MWGKCRLQGFMKNKNGEKSIKTDYKRYVYSGREWLLYGTEATCYVCLITYFFYRSWKWMIPVSPLALLFLFKRKKEMEKKRMQILSLQFKDALTSINASLQAGYSLENAFGDAYREMCRYHGMESMIAKELQLIKRGIHNGQPIEVPMLDFGKRSGIEEITDFSTVLTVAKKSGGNLNEIIQKSIGVIEEKMDTRQEIDTLLSGKKLEAKIMTIIPFFIILYMDITSKGYFIPLYKTIGGNILMTICLGMYLSAMGISQKIVNIDV